MSLRRGHGCPPRTTEVDETVGVAWRGTCSIKTVGEEIDATANHSRRKRERRFV